MRREFGEPLRTAIYARVSTEEQAEHGTSLDEQVRRCEAYCASQGWTVVAVHREEGVSGTRASRPELDRLMRSARKHELDAIVVSKLDRWGRSMRHLSTVLGDLDDLHVRFASVGEAIDSSTASGRLLRNVLGAIAEFEREAIIERTSSGLRAVARGGWWPGGPPPYGYRVEREGGRPRLCVDDAEAAVLLLAVECLVDRRLTTWQTAKELNALGYAPRRALRWTHHNLRRLLLDARGLSGRWPYRRTGRGHGSSSEEIVVEVPAILTAERHQLLTNVLGGTSSGPGATARKTSYLLVGRLRAACGASMHGAFRRDRGTRTYQCSSARAEAYERCTCRRCDAFALEGAVWAEVAAILTDPERLLSLAQTALDLRSTSETVEDRDLNTVDRRVRRLEKALGSTVATLARRGMDVAVINAATAELEEDLARLRQHRETLRVWQLQSQNQADRVHRLWELARQAEHVLIDPNPELQRRVLDLLDVQVRVISWQLCEECEGKGFISSGVAPRTRSRGATGVVCPGCQRRRFIPVITISGVVPDVATLEPVQASSTAVPYPFRIVSTDLAG